MKPKFKRALLGGTFDHFHAGHAHFLNAALASAEELNIGLTTQNLTTHKAFPYSIEDYTKRLSGLEKFLSENDALAKSKVIKIKDAYGTGVTDRAADAIVVTSHGLKNAEAINQERESLGIPPLYIYKVDYLRGSDGKIISSTRIRSGEIDRLGNSFADVFRKTLRLPDALREETRTTPSGTLVKTSQELKTVVGNIKFIVAVGDIISQNLINIGRPADINVVDLTTKKQKISDVSFNNMKTILAQNMAGELNRGAIQLYIKSLKSREKIVLKINGEEDLFALPAVLLSPLDTLVLYGMPNIGAIAVMVTEEKKKEVLTLLKKLKD